MRTRRNLAKTRQVPSAPPDAQGPFFAHRRRRIGLVGLALHQVVHRFRAVEAGVVGFDYGDVLPTIRRAHPHASLADAEDAAQVAVEEHLRNGVPLTAANVIQRARSRLLTAKKREARTLSLDAFAEADVDSAPAEFAIEEVDFDSHVELAEARQNPILRRRLEATERGSAPKIQARGEAAPTTRYPIEIVKEARRLQEGGQSFDAISRQLGIDATTIVNWCRGIYRRIESNGWSCELIVEAFQAFYQEEGRGPTAEDVKRDARLPALNVLYRHFPSMEDALRAAGLPASGWRVWDRESVLEVWIEFKERTGRWPRDLDIRVRSSGLPGYSAIRRCFGTSSLVQLARLAEARHDEDSSSPSAARA